MKLEIRGAEVTISGYVNAVCRDSRVMKLPDGTKFVEQVEEGVFAKALASANNVALKLDHDRVIGGTADGTLKLKEDSIGLYATAKVTDEEVVKAANEGQINGWSFGFNMISDEWEHWTEDGIKRRILKDIQLNEVSIMVGCFPAYKAMSYEVRDEEEKIFETRATEKEKVEVSVVQKSFNDLEIKKMKLELMKQEV